MDDKRRIALLAQSSMVFNASHLYWTLTEALGGQAIERLYSLLGESGKSPLSLGRHVTLGHMVELINHSTSL